MPPWLLLLTLPGALLLLTGILWLSAIVEERALSPRSMIVSAARGRLAKPEYAEAIVAREFERLLRETQEA